MNVWNSLRRLFEAKTETPPVAPEPPKLLRNRPNRMAWIQGLTAADGCPGCEAMNGRAVKTLCDDGGGFWRIEPPQEFTVTETSVLERRTGEQVSVVRGHVPCVTVIHDDRLQPWHDLGDDDAADESLWQPSPRISDALIADGRVILPMRVREMDRT